MIGDRYLTDVVYGNRHGLLTIRPAPLTLEGEPSAVLLVCCSCYNSFACLWPAHTIQIMTCHVTWSHHDGLHGVYQLFMPELRAHCMHLPHASGQR